MRPVRILTVDGNSDFLVALNNWLELSPMCQVVGSAESGAEALAQVKQLQPDLVLMNSLLSDMGGLQATLMLKACDNAPKVIVLTLDNEPVYYTAYRERADGMLDKADITVGLLPLIRLWFPNGTA